MADYMPRPDAEFSRWLAEFVDYAQANAGALGLDAADVAALTETLDAWEGAFAEHLTAMNAAKAATGAKDDARTKAQRIVRGRAGPIQARPETTDAQRLGLGLAVRGASRAPHGAPRSSPRALVDAGTRLVHRVRWLDDGGGRARPAGVDHAELWVFVGDEPPANPARFRFVATARRAPYAFQFADADIGRMAHWALRWVSTRGEPGPWGRTVGATVGG